jgi:CRISPR-associated protein Csd1
MFLENLYNNAEDILKQIIGETVPPPGYQVSNYHWKVSLFSDNPERFVFLPIMNDKGKADETLILPTVARSSNKLAFYLSDWASYVFKINDPKKDLNVEGKHELFMETLRLLYEATKSKEVKCISNFLTNFDMTKVPENMIHFHRIVFEIDNSIDYILDESIVNFISSDFENNNKNKNKVKKQVKKEVKKEDGDSYCSITGKKCKTALYLPMKIKCIPGNHSQYSLISNNNEIYVSYGLKDWKVSSLSEEAIRMCYLALNALSSSQDHSYTFGPYKFVWFAKSSFGLPFIQDPKLIKDFLESYKTGKIYSDRSLRKSDKFYLYCLSTNSVRVVLNFSIESNISEFYESQYKWLTQTSVNNYIFCMYEFCKLFGDKNPASKKYLFDSAFFGYQLPVNLVFETLNMFKSKKLGSFLHKHKNEFALLGLLRYYVIKDYQQQMKNSDHLPENLDSLAFKLGRLFAEYQELQFEVSPKVNTSITSSHLTMASTHPETVFGFLNINAQKHLDYLRKQDRLGAYYSIKSRVDDIISSLPSIPVSLNLKEQCEFMLGMSFQSNLLKEQRIANKAKKEASNEI